MAAGVITRELELITFYIVRHGETLLNRLGRAQGWSDSPLTANGIADAKELGSILKGVRFSGAYCSDTNRAKTTCELILEESDVSGVPIFEDARLREWCLGSMDAELNAQFIHALSEWLEGGLSLKDMNQHLPQVADVIYEHDETGMAQSFSEIEDRLISALQEIARSHHTDEDGNVLVVTHAFVIKTLLHLYAPDKLLAVDKISHTDVLRLQYEDGDFRFA